jgi:hypothetical protein
MKKVFDPLRIVLEFIRFLIIILLFGAIMGGLANLIYSIFGITVVNTPGGGIVGISILILLFVLYKNKLQFNGFYKGEGQKKLSKRISGILVSCSLIMLIIAPFFH